MIMRIRVVTIRPGTLRQYKEVARDWRDLLQRNGGRVIGFYFDHETNTATGIAEYESREQLRAIQARCEADEAFVEMTRRSDQIVTSFDERILDKLNVDLP